jgi:hypothetical protein
VLSVGASAVFALPYAIFIILFFLRFITTFACTFLNAKSFHCFGYTFLLCVNQELPILFTALDTSTIADGIIG